MKEIICTVSVGIVVTVLFIISGCSGGESLPDNGGDDVFLPTGNLIFVCCTRGNDSNLGTVVEPMQTIQSAIDYADTQYAAASVIVAAGTYSKDFNTEGSPVVTLKEGISLYGGYSSDFLMRSTTSYETILQDTSLAGGVGSNPNRAVEGDGSVTSITNATIVDGFTINGGGGEFSSGIFNTGSSAPTIQNNIINGGSGSDYSYGISNLSSNPLVQNNNIDGGDAPTRAHGIYNSSSSPTIQYNTLLGGDHQDNSRTFAIFNSGGSPTIQNNAITAGIGTPSYGIRSEYSSPIIINNTVHGGTEGLCYGVNDVSSTSTVRNNTVVVGGASSSNTYPVYLGLGSETVIENNILITTGGSYRCGICEESSSDNPASVRNNNVYHDGIGGTQMLYYDADGGGSLTDVSTMEQNLNNEGTTASGNVTVDPLFDAGSSDGLLLSASSPDSVTQEGINGVHSTESWGYAIDKNGAQRSPLDDSSSTGWSMGAYEY